MTLNLGLPLYSVIARPQGGARKPHGIPQELPPISRHLRNAPKRELLPLNVLMKGINVCQGIVNSRIREISTDDDGPQIVFVINRVWNTLCGVSHSALLCRNA